jgi:transposase
MLLDDHLVTINAADGGTVQPVTLKYAIGYDWDEVGGVFALTDASGKNVKRIRVEATTAGLQAVVDLAEPYRVNGILPPIIVEDTRRPLLTQLTQAGFDVYIANSNALTYYRQAEGKLKRQKSDRHDALLLGRRFLDRPGLHRNLAPISALGVELTTLSRQEAAITRELVDAANRLRSMLAEANPAILKVWRAAQLTDGPTPCRWLQLVPTGTAGAQLTEKEIDTLLKEHKIGGGARAKIVKKLHAAYQAGCLHYDPEVDATFGRLIQLQATNLLQLIDQQAALDKLIQETLAQSPIAQLFSDATGLGPKILGRVLGEIGDDPHRFQTLRGFLAYAAATPYTDQSGKGQRNLRRRARGNNLHAALRFWADAAKHHHPGARQYYWELREKGDFHQTAVRKVMTRIARAFWHCYSTGEIWDDNKLWKPARPDLDQWVLTVQAKVKKTDRAPTAK